MSASAFHHRNKTNVKPILRFVLTLLLGYQGLAADGLRFTQFYNTARCWPS